MPTKKNKSKVTRSRSVSRGRSVSRSRKASVKKSISRSPSRKSLSKTKAPASEPKISIRRSPSISSESHDESVNTPAPRLRTTRAPSLSRPGVRVSHRIIEKLESSQMEKLSSSPMLKQMEQTPNGFICKIKNAGCSTFCCVNNVFMSQGLASFNTIITIPIFVFWAVFLIISPTSENAFANVLTPWGPGWAFGGVGWPTDIDSYFNPYAFINVVVFLVLVIVASLIMPFGRRLTVVTGGRRSEVKANGLLILMLCIACLFALQYKGADFITGFSISHVCKFWPTIITAAWISAIHVAIIAYWNSRNMRRSSINSNKPTGNIMVDFCNGREIRPRIMSLDLKMAIFYPSLIGLLVLEVAVALRQYEEHNKISPALATVVLLNSVAILDFFVFEPTILSSFGMIHDGFGLERIQRFFMVVPFMRLLTVLYLGYNFSAGYPNSELVSCDGLLMFGSLTIFLIGLMVRRFSTNQKYLFRRDPQHPSFDNMLKIPTSSGRPILAGSWWGRLRHPNYLGEILMAVASSIPAGFVSPLPWITPVTVILVLLVHSIRVERTCAEKYGPGWERYAAHVPYRFIPRVY